MPDAEEMRHYTIDGDHSEIVSSSQMEWNVETDVLVVGGGGCGLVAALAALENPNITVTVLEKEDELGGNTAQSTGMIPASGSRFQREAGVEETWEDMYDDIMTKSKGEADEDMVERLSRQSKYLIEWLIDDWNITLEYQADMGTFPGHSGPRMHCPPGANGEVLVDELQERIESQDNSEILTNTPVRKLVVEDGGVVGAVAGKRRTENINAQKVILASDGFGANGAMVQEYLDEISEGIYFGAAGNTGDGIRWGAELGADLEHINAYQGHATVAYREGVLSTYTVIRDGGILINVDGERFGNELDGAYSGFARHVLKQPGGVAYEIFDKTIYDELYEFYDDFQEAVELGAYKKGQDIKELAETLGFNAERARQTLEDYNEAVEAGGPDEVGREECLNTLKPPFYGTEVTGALFHTQGGLVVDEHARVETPDGSTIPNLYAGGGVAVGVSGNSPDGYLGGNGLTSALGLGRLAGIHARDSLSGESN